MVIFSTFKCNKILLSSLRNVSKASKKTRRTNNGSGFRKSHESELKISPEMFDAVEQLSNSLINDTSRSVASSLTEEHSKLRRRIKAAIIYKKNFSGPPQLSILTYRAKEQISHLSKTDSSEWSADTISQYFPISHQGAMRLLHKQDKAPNRFFRSLEDVIRHDTQCIKRWLMLMETICSAQVYNQAKNNKSQTLEALSTLLPEGLRWIGLNDVLEKLAFADGNSTLPFPPQTSVEAYNFVKSRHQPGPFELIAEKFHKSQCTANDSVAIREQQLTVIEKLISLFKNMDFSIFTEPLMNDDSLTFNMLCRDWLITDPNTELLEQPSPPKVRSKVDCDFTKIIQYKRICT
uniref:C2H2-type domain-containing protein n=1 Tax=Mesocestoides corti TaxID=53468 RepID=A0A5K3EFR1_MESCO